MWKKARPVPYALWTWNWKGGLRKVSPSPWRRTTAVDGDPVGGGAQVGLARDYRMTVSFQLDIVKHPLPSPEVLFARIKGKRFAKA